MDRILCSQQVHMGVQYKYNVNMYGSKFIILPVTIIHTYCMGIEIRSINHKLGGE